MPVRGDEFLPYLDPVRKLRRHNRPLCYAVAIAAVALAGLSRWALEGVLASGVPFITFFPAVIASAFVGGFGPGLLSVILSVVVADYFFIPPPFSFALSWGDTVALALFATIAGFDVVLVALLNEAIDRIARQEQNARLILETAPAGMIAVDHNGAITLANAAAEKLFGYRRDELIGQHIELLVPERLRSSHVVLRDLYLSEPSTRPMGAGRDLYGRQKTGTEVPLEVALNPVVRDDKAGALATILDISERRAAERRQEILVREVQHRAKNVLSIIQVIAARTFVPGRSVEEGLAKFDAKVKALARTQDMFFTTGKATLAGIVGGELVGLSDQVTVEGVDLALTPVSAQNFTLIAHELTTNALKHGSLSVPTGTVSVQCRAEAGDLVLTWAEHGGPAPVATGRMGFGQVILNDLAKGFGATVSATYAPDGFAYVLRVPLKMIAEAGPAAGGASAA